MFLPQVAAYLKKTFLVPRKLAFLCVCLCALFAFLGAFSTSRGRIYWVQDDLNRAVGPLKRHFADESKPFLLGPSGIMVSKDRPVDLILRFSMAPGETSRIIFATAAHPGFRDRIIAFDPKRAGSPEIARINTFEAGNGTVPLDQFQTSNVVEIHYQAWFDGPGQILAVDSITYSTSPVIDRVLPAIGWSLLLGLVLGVFWFLARPNFVLMSTVVLVLFLGQYVWRDHFLTESLYFSIAFSVAGAVILFLRRRGSRPIPFNPTFFRRAYRFGSLALFLLLSVDYGFQAVRALNPPFKPIHSGDEDVYQAMRKLPWNSSKLWAGSRPFVAPVLHKIGGDSDEKTVKVQIVFMIAGVVALGGVLFLMLGARLLGLIAAGLLYLFALSPVVNAWNLVIRSESAGFSTLFLALAGSFLFLNSLLGKKTRAWSLIPLCALFLLGMILLAFTRDNWAYQLPVMAVLIPLPLVVPPYWKRRTRLQRWMHVVVPVLLLSFFVVHKKNADVFPRWKFPLLNSILTRILPSATYRAEWKENYGLPVNDALMKHKGQMASFDKFAIYKNKEFMAWVDEKGLHAYTHHALRHWRKSCAETRSVFLTQVDNFVPKYYEDKGQATPLARFSKQTLFFPLGRRADLALLWVIFFPLAVLVLAPRPYSSIAGGVFLFGVGLPLQSAVCFLGDAMEIERHSLGVGVTLRLLLLFTVILLAALVVHGLLEIGRYLVAKDGGDGAAANRVAGEEDADVRAEVMPEETRRT